MLSSADLPVPASAARSQARRPGCLTQVSCTKLGRRVGSGILSTLGSAAHQRRLGCSARALLFGALLLPTAAPPISGQSLLLKVPSTEPPPSVHFTTPAATERAAPQSAAVGPGLSI